MNDTIRGALVIMTIIGVGVGGMYSCTVNQREERALRKEAACGTWPSERDADKIRAALAKDPSFYKNECQKRKDELAAKNSVRRAYLLTMEKALLKDTYALCAKFHQLRLNYDDRLPFYLSESSFVQRVADMCMPMHMKDQTNEN